MSMDFKEEFSMKDCYIKGQIESYEGDGEYWVFVADDSQSRLIDNDYILPAKDTDSPIPPEDITGVLGQLLDEVELPSELHEQISDLYKRAAELL